jgi:SNF2-related domain
LGKFFIRIGRCKGVSFALPYGQLLASSYAVVIGSLIRTTLWFRNLDANFNRQQHSDLIKRIDKARNDFKDDQRGLDAALKEIGPIKPWLIKVPGNLVTQWCQEATKMSSHFRLFVYHTDRKKTSIQVNMADEANPTLAIDIDFERIHKPLTRGSGALANIISNATGDYSKITLVITTPQTWQVRHGPSLLSRHRIARYDRQLKGKQLTAYEHHRKCLDAREGGRLWGVTDSRWPRNLEGVFEGLVIDEAHTYRNPASQCTIGAKWLKANKRFLMTATPVYHSHRDVLGYLALLEKQENVKAQSHYNHMDLAEFPTGLAACSPYDTEWQNRKTVDGKLDVETRRRSMTVAAYRKYAIPRNPVSESHHALMRVFDECLVRHNYTSSFPAGSPEHSIGKKLPHNIRMTRQSRFSEKWQAIFKYYGEKAYKRIRMPLKSAPGASSTNTQTLGINGNTHRHLTTASTVPALNLVGVPKDHNCLFVSGRLKLDQSRAEYVTRAQQAWIEKKRNEIIRRAKKEPALQWVGYPEGKPKVDKSSMPGKLSYPFSLIPRVVRRSLLCTTQWKSHHVHYTLWQLGV